MRILSSLALSSLCLVSAAHADLPAAGAQSKAKPGDFASGIELTTEPGLAVQTFLLPLDVYRGAHADLSDLSVFDAEGRPVAWATRTLTKTEELRQHEELVPFFAIYGQPSARPSELALQVERSASGTVIAVRTPEHGKPAQEQKLLAYIVHTAAPTEDITALRLELEPSEASYVLPIQIEGSDNLSDWQVLANGESIGRLAHGDQLVERTRVPVRATRAAFLRITWSGELPAAVRQVRIERQRVHSAKRLEPRRLTVGPVTLANGAYRIDLGGQLALVSLTPRLPPEDVLLKVSLFADEASGARAVFGGLLYRLPHASVVLNSPAIPLAGVRARVLILRVDTEAAEPPKQPLTFDVDYEPDQLLFVAHGSRPHLLAFGSYQSTRAPFAADQLLAFLTAEQQASLPLESVHAGPLKTLGGEAARKEPKKPLPVRTVLLWAVLIAGAGTLIVLALRLLNKTRGA